MTQREMEIRRHLHHYDLGHPDPLQDNAADDVRDLLDLVASLRSQLEEATRPIAEQFAALGWQIDSVEDAANHMSELSGMARIEAAKRIAAEYRAASPLENREETSNG